MEVPAPPTVAGPAIGSNLTTSCPDLTGELTIPPTSQRCVGSITTWSSTVRLSGSTPTALRNEGASSHPTTTTRPDSRLVQRFLAQTPDPNAPAIFGRNQRIIADLPDNGRASADCRLLPGFDVADGWEVVAIMRGSLIESSEPISQISLELPPGRSLDERYLGLPGLDHGKQHNRGHAGECGSSRAAHRRDYHGSTGASCPGGEVPS